jgi:hypothetical protein
MLKKLKCKLSKEKNRHSEYYSLPISVMMIQENVALLSTSPGQTGGKGKGM